LLDGNYLTEHYKFKIFEPRERANMWGTECASIVWRMWCLKRGTRRAAIEPCVLSLAIALSFGAAQDARAAPIVLDGTFLNSIGTGENSSPWSDWTNAGITRALAPSPIPGNYASLPLGADLFQDFSALPNGTYELSFLAQNQSPWAAELVFAIQQALGTPVSTVFNLGTGEELDLPASSAFIPITLDFTINNPPFTPNELTFSNSYDAAVAPIQNSKNPVGTIIDIADVSLVPISAPYTLRLFNVDDVMSAYITNADYTDQLVLQATFLQDTGNVDISRYIEPGLNDLLIQDYNFFQGWTYGYDFEINGASYASGSCGTANVFGCNDNAQGPDNQVVFSTNIQFDAPSPPSRIPEPSSLASLLSGLLSLMAMRRLHRSA
jgi:hypothetical protein